MIKVINAIYDGVMNFEDEMKLDNSLEIKAYLQNSRSFLFEIENNNFLDIKLL